MSLRHLVLAIALALTLPAGPVALAQQEAPAALADWRDWVLHGEEHRRCPFWMSGAFGAPERHVCAWPGRLRLDARATSLRFATGWTVYADAWLPLPGEAGSWPLAVRVNGAPAPVVERAGAPAVRVGTGRHQVEGEIHYRQRPELLRVPEGFALVELSLDGQTVFPLQRSGSSLWLGRPEAAAGQSDALAVQVYRKVSDGLPPLLETRVRLEVSGQGREGVLGPVLPAGFVPTGISSPLTALLEGDGRLRLQLRPGNWQVVVAARGLAPLAALDAQLPGGAWPTEEIWSYEARPELRVTSADGGRAVDPSQVDVPAEWSRLPAFAVGAGARLEVEERSRGQAEDDANRLTLRRELWFDFSGDGLTARDTVGGRMVRDFRLDLARPFVLTRASAGAQPLLVTRGAAPGLSGVELRNPQVDLTASSRVDRWRGALPVTGWQSPFEQVSLTLHLPPGRELVAAPGADSSPQSWVSRWSLLDVFLLLVTSMLAFRLLGRTGGGIAFAFLALSYHESAGPLWCLLVVLLLALLHRALPVGRLASGVAVVRTLALLVAALVLLPFVAQQLRLALYPQLERPVVGTRDGVLLDHEGFAASATREEMVQADQVEPRAVFKAPGSYQSVQQLQRYAASNVFQAGGGEPGWSWRRAQLSWSGPVLPDQTVRLLVTPAWLTRLLRALLVGLLALTLTRLVRAVRGAPTPAEASSPVGVVLALLLLGSASGASAQTTPDAALLEQLRQRLLAPPECTPSCGHLEGAVVEVARDRLAVTLTVHAAALVAAPVPSSEAAWRVTEVTVNGVPRSELLRQETGGWWLALPRGVHRVELRGEVAPVDALNLRFPAAPARLTVRSAGWDATGLRDGRLLTDTLGLVRVRGASDTPAGEGGAARVPPFVTVTRELDLDLDWSVTTRVERVAPREGSLAVEVPLLPGESVLTPGYEAVDGRVTVALAAGVSQALWQSRLERAERLELTAASLDERSETWRVTVSPQWSARFEGVPPTLPAGAEDYWVHEYHPLPGETLALTVVRPEAVAGATLAVDRASLDTRAGRRASEHTLTLHLRSTRGGQHTLTLPATAEVLGVRLDGDTLNVRPQDGRLTVPVHPGEQRLEVRWRHGHGAGLRTSTPAVDLGANASNLDLRLELPADRWVLLTHGPRVGPAVLYWGELAVMALLALLLARLGRSPLALHDWFLLGLGFSTFSWLALAAVVVWLLALDARGRAARDVVWWHFDLRQLALVGLTGVALGCLLAAVPFGLLAAPDMHVDGNSSSALDLRWFEDQTTGPLPTAGAVSAPLFLYRLAMLAWALWLATAVVRWLRWGWQCLTGGGGWMRPPRRAVPAADTAPSGGANEPPADS